MEIINGPIRKQRGIKANRLQDERRANGRMGKQARKVIQDVQELGGIAKDVAQEKLGNLRESASEYKDEGQDRVQQAQHTIEKFIRDRPLKTVLIAAGIGLLFGRFWMRR